MKRKILLSSILPILLIAFVDLALASGSAVINVDPSYLQVDIATTPTFTVSINITDVEEPGLYGYELKLFFDTTLLNITKADIEYPDGHFLDWTDNFPTPIIINYDQGYVLLGGILLGDVGGTTGSGVLATAEFTGLDLGDALLEIRDVTLLDPDGQEMDYTVNDGVIDIIPEFTPALMIFLLVTMTIVAIMLRKLTPSMKHNACRTD